MDLIGASELLISWPMTRISRCHAWRSSSRSERLTSVMTSSSSGMPPWRKWPLRTSQRPVPPGNVRLALVGPLIVRHCASPSSSAVLPSSRSIGPGQQPLAGAVDDAQPPLGIEGEDRDGNLLHHRAQQRRGFERTQALLAQRVGQRVHLEEHFAERVVAPLTAGADREVLFAQGRQQVRQRLERVDDAVAQRHRDAPPQPDDEEREGPLDLGGEVAAPQQDERDGRAGQARAQGHQPDAAVVGEPVHGR